jgi:hypothetical protein
MGDNWPDRIEKLRAETARLTAECGSALARLAETIRTARQLRDEYYLAEAWLAATESLIHAEGHAPVSQARPPLNEDINPATRPSPP